MPPTLLFPPATAGGSRAAGGGGGEEEGGSTLPLPPATSATAHGGGKAIAYTGDTSPEAMEGLGRAGWRFDLGAYARLSHAWASVHIGRVLLEEGEEGVDENGGKAAGRRQQQEAEEEEEEEEEGPKGWPLVTVLIPAHDAAPFIREALRSAAVQRGPFRCALCVCVGVFF